MVLTYEYFILSIFTVAALQGPKARQSVKTGATAQLHCTSKQNVEIDWFQGTIFDNNLTNLSSNNNYTIDDDTGTLTIAKFDRQYHSGPYTCRGQYSDDRVLYSCPGTLIYDGKLLSMRDVPGCLL